ncbi:MAG: hypothetical protein NT046_00065 [Arenimonas sp.]|nr:hypothetical protein [Arenimonas sp.]
MRQAEAPSPLAALIEAELLQPVPPAISAFAARLATQGQGALAVLFYGSNLRTGDLEGVLDFYILVERLRDWHGAALPALANQWLPPNVGYHEWVNEAGQTLRAKVAVLDLEQFRRGVAGRGIDTTLWARFAQPTRLIWTRDALAAEAAVAALAAAVVTASRWAALLGPERGMASDYWDAVFARTYAAELRVEKSTRPLSLAAHDPQRYAQALYAGWQADGLAFSRDTNGVLVPALTPEARLRAERAWSAHARWGKPLNLLRLTKSVFTFAGGADYVAWKVERHSGYRLPLSDWQRRHPLLAAPKALWTLWRRGVLR